MPVDLHIFALFNGLEEAEKMVDLAKTYDVNPMTHNDHKTAP